MPIEKGLLLKGLGVCAICAGGATVALKWKDISSAFSTEKKISVAGLECEDEDGGDCRIKDAESGGKILVKKEESSSHFEVTSLGEGKIKVYRVKGEGEKPKNDVFKFVIEEADIASGDTNKLEEFETYEVKKGEEGGVAELKGKEYLFLKTKAKEGIKKALGLPWDLPDSASEEHQNISNTDLKDIKFKGGNASISGGTVTLTISKDSSKDSYPFGYKFTFKNNAETNANLSYGSKKVIIKKGIDVDFGIRREGKNLFLDSWSLEDLAEKVGLKKGNDGYWTIGDSGLNIKQGSNKEKGRERLTNQQGKIKVYEGQDGYYQGLKFSVELGDLGLKTKQDSTINVLGQYESYEIKKDEDGTWYLSRVKDPRQTIKTSLGLPCELPTDSQDSVECSGEISTIKFSGAETVTTTGSPKLTIHKENLRVSYPLGYRFSFTSTSDTPETSITIGNEKKVLKQGVDVDFKIKLEAGGNMSLEGWTLEALMEEVYFKKKDEDWTLGDGTMNIKQGERKSTLVTKKGEPAGKIKLQKEVPGYNQGYKFTIEDGNLNLESEDSISQLSKYETYEVSLDPDGYFYFTRKMNVIEVIKEKLGFPKECIKSTEECKELTQEKLKLIKFDGKGDSEEVTIGEGGTSVTIKVERGDSTDFPYGYKFTLISDKDVTIPQTSAPSSPISIKGNINTEFKIKESGGKFTLEKAWDADKLGKKISLTSCGNDGNQKKCSFGTSINIWESDDSYAENAYIDTKDKKITYEEDKDGYNQGFKFFVEEEISLAAGKGSATKPNKIIKKGDSDTPTYEIAQKTVNKKTSWYLVKKGG